jgi:hypothetical protein
MAVQLIPWEVVLALRQKAGDNPDFVLRLVSATLRAKLASLPVAPAGSVFVGANTNSWSFQRNYKTIGEADVLVQDLTSIFNKVSLETLAKFSEELKVKMKQYLVNNDATIVQKFVTKVYDVAIKANANIAFSSKDPSSGVTSELYAKMLQHLNDQLVVSSVRRTLTERVMSNTDTTGRHRCALMIFAAQLYTCDLITTIDIRDIMGGLVADIGVIAKTTENKQRFGDSCCFLMAILKKLPKNAQLRAYVRGFHGPLRTIVSGFRTDKAAWPGADNRGIFQLEDIVAGKW